MWKSLGLNPPWKQAKLVQGEHWLLNPLCHRGTLSIDFFFLFKAALQHMDVPGLVVESYTTGTATLDLSHICNWQQRWILSPLRRAGIEPTFSRTLCWVPTQLSHNRSS